MFRNEVLWFYKLAENYDDSGGRMNIYKTMGCKSGKMLTIHKYR